MQIVRSNHSEDNSQRTEGGGSLWGKWLLLIGMELLVHRAFAHRLDRTFAVTAAFGLVAAILVLASVRPSRNESAPPFGPSSEPESEDRSRPETRQPTSEGSQR
jgi:uncharacterized membrane protein YqjE